MPAQWAVSLEQKLRPHGSACTSFRFRRGKGRCARSFAFSLPCYGSTKPPRIATECSTVRFRAAVSMARANFPWHLEDIILIYDDCPPQATHVFLGRNGRPLDVNNLRHRVWYPTLAQASLRRRTMYKTRHTFASLMLSNSEDPIWVARMLGHARLDMIFGHYGKFIRNRSRRDGVRFLQAFTEAKVATGTVDMGIRPIPANLLTSRACGDHKH